MQAALKSGEEFVYSIFWVRNHDSLPREGGMKLLSLQFLAGTQTLAYVTGGFRRQLPLIGTVCHW